eukprot:g53419.t1
MCSSSCFFRFACFALPDKDRRRTHCDSARRPHCRRCMRRRHVTLAPASCSAVLPYFLVVEVGAWSQRSRCAPRSAQRRRPSMHSLRSSCDQAPSSTRPKMGLNGSARCVVRSHGDCAGSDGSVASGSRRVTLSGPYPVE